MPLSEHDNHEEMYRHVIPMVDEKTARSYNHHAVLECREDSNHVRYILPSFWSGNDCRRWINRHRDTIAHFTPATRSIELVTINFDRNISDIVDLSFYKMLDCPVCSVELHVCNVLTANTKLSIGNLGDR